MNLEVIKHRDILFRDLLRAIAMKSVGWSYSLESQVRWIVDNMHDEDEHVFLKDGDKDMAYMTLSPVTGMLNGSLASFLVWAAFVLPSPEWGMLCLMLMN